MSTQFALTSPGIISADVCHLNLYKSYCISHCGGGLDVGSIDIASHLPFYPVLIFIFLVSLKVVDSFDFMIAKFKWLIMNL